MSTRDLAEAYAKIFDPVYRRAKRTHHLVQALLLILSAAAVALLAMPAPWQRWGYVVGLASQPLWLAATWRARQWGMFALAVWYVGAWSIGIANHFHP